MLLKMKPLIILFVGAILFSNITFSQIPNTLTQKETQQGWKLLFNGKDLVGWHSYQEKVPGKAWQVQDGNIMLNKNNRSVDKDYADLVYTSPSPRDGLLSRM